MTGLAASWISGRPAFEAAPLPGGICRCYYLRPGQAEPARTAPEDNSAYRFENGGGHWVFGGDRVLNAALGGFANWRRYRRKSSVFFPESKLFVPYPLQYNLRYLDPTLASWALDEMRRAPTAPASQGTPTMASWMEQVFGATLTDLFFGPFHELYTAGLWREIAPQDGYKSPVDLSLVERGLREDVPEAGYNNTFLYPESGLSAFADALAARADVRCGMRVVRIDTAARAIEFEDGSTVDYSQLVSTLPLHHMLALTGLDAGERTDPCTAVLVLNVGGVRGADCPDDHWVYVPRSRSGFHRVGIYSNVDSGFTPAGLDNRASFYVERAFRAGQAPESAEVAAYSQSVLDELLEWGFLESAEAIHATWVDVAYTWSWPGSRWRETAMEKLAEAGILMTGRYGKWKFQGIADSLRDGMLAGASLLAQS